MKNSKLNHLEKSPGLFNRDWIITASSNIDLTKESLLNQAIQATDNAGFSEKKSQVFLYWLCRYTHFHNNYALHSLKPSQVQIFLSHMATELNLPEKLQQQVLTVLTFFYWELLGVKLRNIEFLSNKKLRGYASRFGKKRCQNVITYMQGTSQLAARLLVATNMKLNEVIKLRICDIDFKKNKLTVNASESTREFKINIPIELILDLRIQTIKIRHQTQKVNLMLKGRINNSQPESNLLLDPQYQYLFSHNTHIRQYNDRTIRQLTLSVLKNDIRVAIKQYVAFSSEAIDSVQAKAKNQFNSLLLAGEKSKQHDQRQLLFNFNKVNAA